jgi:hypothetical protein
LGSNIAMNHYGTTWFNGRAVSSTTKDYLATSARGSWKLSEAGVDAAARVPTKYPELWKL